MSDGKRDFFSQFECYQIINIFRLIALQLHAMHSLGGEKLKQNVKKNSYIEEWMERYWTSINSADMKPALEDPRFVIFTFTFN